MGRVLPEGYVCELLQRLFGYRRMRQLHQFPKDRATELQDVWQDLLGEERQSVLFVLPGHEKETMAA